MKSHQQNRTILTYLLVIDLLPGNWNCKMREMFSFPPRSKHNLMGFLTWKGVSTYKETVCVLHTWNNVRRAGVALEPLGCGSSQSNIQFPAPWRVSSLHLLLQPFSSPWSQISMCKHWTTKEKYKKKKKSETEEKLLSLIFSFNLSIFLVKGDPGRSSWKDHLISLQHDLVSLYSHNFFIICFPSIAKKMSFCGEGFLLLLLFNEVCALWELPLNLTSPQPVSTKSHSFLFVYLLIIA